MELRATGWGRRVRFGGHSLGSINISAMKMRKFGQSPAWGKAHINPREYVVAREESR